MRIYYTHKHGKQLGPFSLEELKEQGITNETDVWREGMSEWQKASNVEELRQIIASTPPPINLKSSPPPLPKLDSKEKLNVSKDSKSPEKKSNLIYYLGSSLVLILILGFVMFGNYQAKQERMDRELQEQNAKIQEQERIEKERIDEANRVQREQELQQLKFELNNAQVELELAKERLVKAKEFKFLRTAQEKENDIAVVVYEIKAVEETIQDLNSRISKY
jgi:hypothetical protein